MKKYFFKGKNIFIYIFKNFEEKNITIFFQNIFSQRKNIFFDRMFFKPQEHALYFQMHPRTPSGSISPERDMKNKAVTPPSGTVSNYRLH